MTDCGAIDGVSFWAGPFAFTSACSTLMAPFSDDTEAHTATTTLTNSLCWNASALTGYDWNISSADTPLLQTQGLTQRIAELTFFILKHQMGQQVIKQH